MMATLALNDSMEKRFCSARQDLAEDFILCYKSFQIFKTLLHGLNRLSSDSDRHLFLKTESITTLKAWVPFLRSVVR